MTQSQFEIPVATETPSNPLHQVQRRIWTHRFNLLAILLAVSASLFFSAQTASCDAARTLTNGPPEEAGFDPRLLQAALDLYRQKVEQDDLRGAVILVARKGQVVMHEAIGWRDKENELPMEKDTLFRMASNTKPIVTTGALLLVEDGKLSLNDRIAQYIPAFDKGDFANITIGQLMSHTSGLPRGPIFLRDVNPTSNLVIEAERFAAELQLESTPGSEYGYSNAGYNILGGVIEVVSGQRLDHFLHQRIYVPLDMRDSNHHESTAEHNRMAKVYVRRDGEWLTRWSPGDDPSYPIIRASGGMISTAWDYAVFLQTWLNGGAFGDMRLLPEEMILQGRSKQSPTESYGYGWQIGSTGVFSHGGSDGTYAWADPERELICLVFTQSPNGDHPREEFQQMVNDAILE